jgi:hypothetical protein
MSKKFEVSEQWVRHSIILLPIKRGPGRHSCKDDPRLAFHDRLTDHPAPCDRLVCERVRAATGSMGGYSNRISLKLQNR